MSCFPSILETEIHGILIYGDGSVRAPLHFTDGKASVSDIAVTLVRKTGETDVLVSAEKTPVSWVILRFPFLVPAGTRICGDAWERGYGDLHWGCVLPERHLPWYFLAYQPEERTLAGYGVRVRPGAMCAWHLDSSGASLFLDVRSGGMGVLLGGRTLEAAAVLFREYENTDAYSAGHDFCRVMCPDPIFPREPVFGSNNWYYAYGHSSRAEILTDSEYIASLTEGLSCRPYMVIDDGWERESCCGPWDAGNADFGDMGSLAAEMKARGVKPGIWTRLLYDRSDNIPKEWRRAPNTMFLDPSHPAVLEHIREDIRRFVGWGYELIKHDYSTMDLFGDFGVNMRTSVAKNGWCFYDRSKTSAEVVLMFYRAIREAAGDAVIIGCNTFSHLCAGLVEVNRTGDDTSGKDWERTRCFGVNTLAFRMMQNRAFYMADADCVGITKEVPWEQNRMWLRALSRSGSPLFISSRKGAADETMLPEIREAFRYNAVQTDTLIPLDWFDTVCPARWSLNGEEISFDWYGENGFMPDKI